MLGGGGREHALAWRLSQSAGVETVYAAPGNPGFGRLAGGKQAVCLPVRDGSPQGLVRLAQEHGIGLTVVGPEAPLIAGVVDAFRAAGLLIFGPTQAAAELEGSKVFSKDFFARRGIPTARYVTAESEAEALRAIGQFAPPYVLKADGLAAGKGVVITSDRAEAEALARQLLSGELAGEAGKRLVIEEFLVGEEVSYIVLTDGEHILPMEPAQDHKRIFDGDQGPNTGGMGAYVDSRILGEEERRRVMTEVLEPTVRGMAAEGRPFTGFLYAGLMMTAEGPKVLEYNVRMGDPETQPLMMALESDLAEVLEAGAKGELHRQSLRWSAEPTMCVVMAAEGYPGKPAAGDAISGIAEAEAEGCVVFQAGTKMAGGELVTAGGRVLAVTASGPTLPATIAKAYRGVEKIAFRGMQYRRDIGGKGLKRW